MNYSLIHIGMGSIPKDWLKWAKYSANADRIYYILEEGVGYFHNDEKHFFKKHHIYIIPNKRDVEFFIEDMKFKHVYMDFLSGNPYLNHDKIIEIPPGEYPLIDISIQHIMLYLTTHKLPSMSSTANPQLFYLHRSRILAITDALLYDIGEIYGVNPIDLPIEKSIAYIKSNYINRITIDDLAKLNNLSSSYFMSLFKKNMGMSPHQYIKNYRLSVALDMLRENYPISRIAEQCGFLSVSAFSNSFTKHFGITPSGYLKSYK